MFRRVPCVSAHNDARALQLPSSYRDIACSNIGLELHCNFACCTRRSRTYFQPHTSLQVVERSPPAAEQLGLGVRWRTDAHHFEARCRVRPLRFRPAVVITSPKLELFMGGSSAVDETESELCDRTPPFPAASPPSAAPVSRSRQCW